MTADARTITSNLSANDLAIAVPPDAINQLEAAFPLVSSRGGDVEALAREAKVSVKMAQAALDDPATAAVLLAAQNKAEDDGRLLKPVAARLTLAMLQKLHEAMDAGELDADDINNLLPKVHRVVENADRIEAQRGNGDAGLNVFHITFNNGRMQARAVPPKLDVIDVDATEVRE